MATIYNNDPTRVLNPAADPDPPKAAVVHTEAEEEYLEDLHRQLKPEAQLAYVNFYLARTPAHLQEDMKELIQGDLTPPPPPESPAEEMAQEQVAQAVAPAPAPEPAKA